jgi:hypothetical protein
MNGDWLATHDRHGVWCLMNVYTEQQIDLPSSATCNIWRNQNETTGPPEMYYKNWGPCLDLLKIVVYEVPREKGYYADYKLIALFDKAIAYLEGGREKWKYLGDPDHFSYPCNYPRRWYYDAIEHGGLIYAVDERGCTYCWDAAEDGNFLAYFICFASNIVIESLM